MKTIIKIVLLGLFLLCNTSFAQKMKSSKKLFVRVYDINGFKIDRGSIVFVNDSILALKRKSKDVKIKVNTIGEIKTKRSKGDYIGTGALIGGLTGAVVGFVSADEETKIETIENDFFGTIEWETTTGTSPATGTIIGAGAGSAAGALVGLGISFFHKSNAYKIDGDLEKWQFFLESENLKR